MNSSTFQGRCRLLGLTPTDFLTEEEARRASRLYVEAEPCEFDQRLADEIIEPVIERINARLGEENEPIILAHAVHFMIFDAFTERRGVPLS